VSQDIYESDELLQQYLLFHYGEAADQMPWPDGPKAALEFPVRCVNEGLDTERIPKAGSALDIGCAVGRSSLELSRFFTSVIGIDYSETFVEAARQMADKGKAELAIKETGKITRHVTLHCAPERKGRIDFEQGDAMDLRADLGSFDCVFAANLLCRLGQPQKFLERLPGLVCPGGQLLIFTPNTWLEEFTAVDYWLGATPETGEPLEALEATLKEDFILDKTWDLPFLIREHRRKYQWSVAQGSRWIRHG
jgi:putative 4-mercaptohistidine N1-methyltranferase